MKKLENLPDNVKRYLDRITELTQTPIFIISVGADRDQTIVLRNPFEY
jgi:adenylosuccinate synthase